jgi:hypothetical protein
VSFGGLKPQSFTSLALEQLASGKGPPLPRGPRFMRNRPLGRGEHSYRHTALKAVAVKGMLEVKGPVTYG